MPQLTFRMNLQSKIFPLLTQLQGQTVIIPDKDQTYMPNVNPADDQNSVDRGIPGMLYAHNVMPSVYGWQSIGYQQRAVSLSSSGEVNGLAHFPRTINGYSSYVAVNLNSGTLTVLGLNGNWVTPTGGPTGLTEDHVLSVATVNGVSYLCVSNKGVYTMTMAEPPTMEVATTEGLDQGNIRGILSSNGYLIAWSATGVAWSSASDPLDFVPDDVTGAGAADIQDADGDLVWCQSTSYGLIVYTRGNAVQATWSGNVAHPWNFRGIPSTGGVESSKVVSKESNGQHWVYTTKGLQSIYHTGAKTVLPFITDFISGKVMDNWNVNTMALEVTVSNEPLQKAVSYVGDRYLIISYGPSTLDYFTHALVWDAVQLRMGKLRFDHVQTFELSSSGVDAREEARDIIGLLKADGSIYSVDFRINEQSHDGVILLGKFQVARGYMSKMVTLVAENINPGTVDDSLEYDTVLFPSLDGKNFQAGIKGYINKDEGLLREIFWNAWGKNHSVLFQGSFNLISIELTLGIDGGR